MSATDRVVVVGAGQAGGRAAEALRAEGFAGDLVLLGDEAEPPYERPALSKQLLLGEVEPESLYLHAREAWAQKGVTLRTGVRAVAIAADAREVLLDDGERLSYRDLVLATGSRVRPLVGTDDSLPGVHYLRTIEDCRRLAADLQPGRRLVVIGGGFIGLEVASSAVRRGLGVTVLERKPALLDRALPADIAAAVERLHRGRGVDILLGTSVSALVPAAGRRAVSAVGLADGTELAADLIVIGIGIIPNTELAEMAGATSEDGVVTDEFGRSSVPGIWAAGDVTNHYNPVFERRVRLESWQNAQNQAICVARNIAGRPAPYSEVPWFWSDQHGVNIQMAGLAAPGTHTVWRGDPSRGRAVAFSLEGSRLVCATAFDAGGEVRYARRLIESCVPVSAEALADPARKLKDLAADLTAA